jgi:transcriptional regulator with XRE-family HTH domain
MTFLESVGPAIRLLRKRVGLTQRGLAEASGVSKNILSNWETGATQPSMGSLIKVLEALDVDLLDFHHTIRQLTGRAAEARATRLPAALRAERTDHLVLLLDRAPEIALWCLQLVNTLRDPAVAAALERSVLDGQGGADA